MNRNAPTHQPSGPIVGQGGAAVPQTRAGVPRHKQGLVELLARLAMPIAIVVLIALLAIATRHAGTIIACNADVTAQLWRLTAIGGACEVAGRRFEAA